MAGAPLSDTVNEFLQSVNIPIAYGYGLSETTATVCFYPEIGFQFGSIGEVMPGVQVKIDPGNNEFVGYQLFLIFAVNLKKKRTYDHIRPTT